MKQEPITLGDKLAPIELLTPHFSFGERLRDALYTALSLTLLTGVSMLPLWWYLMRPDMDRNTMLALLAVMFVVWWLVDRVRRASSIRNKFRPPSIHSLLANDQKGFMRNLRLDAKTAIFDGNNIYHFGHDNGLDAQPLGMLADQLRKEGYRIVCFFDASIFFTLRGHGAFTRGQQHSLWLLEDIFGLRANEIYVVPSGVQADKYILDSLKYLPISFVVTNDQFRDYAKIYPLVIKGNQWRKGVAISKNKIKLLQPRP